MKRNEFGRVIAVTQREFDEMSTIISQTADDKQIVEKFNQYILENGWKLHKYDVISLIADVMDGRMKIRK